MARWIGLWCLSMGGVLGGCGLTDAYILEAKVIRGSYSTMTFVSADDPRLTHTGMSNVQISVYRDPTRPKREMVARTVNQTDGSFSLSIEPFHSM